MPVDDPNTVDGMKAMCFSASEFVGKVPVAGSLLSPVVNIVCGRAEAEKDYLEIRPLLLAQLKAKAPDPATILYLAARLTATAEFGACRANFRSYYIDGKKSGAMDHVDPARVNKLPSSPKDIMFGFWGSYFS